MDVLGLVAKGEGARLPQEVPGGKDLVKVKWRVAGRS